MTRRRWHPYVGGLAWALWLLWAGYVAGASGYSMVAALVSASPFAAQIWGFICVATTTEVVIMIDMTRGVLDRLNRR